MRSADVCYDLLKGSRYDLERVCGDGNKTALAFDAEWARGGHVALALLQNGASSIGARYFSPSSVAIDATDPFIFAHFHAA